MTEINRHNPNMFCWADLATTDVEGAKKFYTDLFGWNATDEPAGEGMFYTMLDKNSMLVCATYEQNEQMRQQDVPPMWQSYVSVEDVDTMVIKATQAGGSVIMQASDIFDYGRMAVVQDPTGAMLALWQAKEHIGAHVWNEPGAICWNELYTNDPTKSIEFYGDLFGWTTQTESGAQGEEYTMFKNGEQVVGGMLQIQKEWGENVPPCWTVYFQVDDLDATLKQVKDLGGVVDSEIMDVQNEGRFCVVGDPQGAFFLLMEMTAKK